MTSGMESNNKNTLKKILMGAVSALIWIGVWEIAYLAVNREVLIASPLSVFLRLSELALEGSFWLKIANSLFAVFKGYLLAFLAGIILCVLTSVSDFAYAVFKPFLNVIRATPVASFIILALVWMSKQTVPVFTSFLMVMPIVWANLTTGVRSTDRKLIEMAKAYKLPKSKILTKIYIPSVMPEFLNSVTTGLGFAWKSAVAAEVLSTPKNTIGAELYNSKVYLETVDLFAWTAVIIIVSIVIEKLLVYFIKRLSKRRAGEI